MLNTNIVPTGASIPVFDSSTEKTSVQDRIKMAENFFKFFFQHVQGYDNNSCYFYLWMQTPDKKSNITKTYPLLSPNKNNVRDCDLSFFAYKAIQFNDEGYHVYFSVNVTDKFIGEHNRATKNDITSQLAIVADIDCKNDKHHSSANLPADLKTARSFLPFTPSILVFSGAGLHVYNLLKNPIHFSNGAERDAAQERNRNYLEMIRAKAEGLKIDSVDALPCILRVPGTYNLKNGRENAPLCRVIETNNSYTLEELDKLIIPRAKPQPKSQKIIVPSISNNGEPSDIERAIAMLDKLPAENLDDYDDWIHVGMILKTNGNDFAVWDNWSSRDTARYKEGECAYKWKGFKNKGALTIATLYRLATTQGTYSEKDFRREWYKANGSAAIDDFDEVDFDKEELKKSRLEKIAYLKSILQEVNKKIYDLETTKKSAETTLNNVISFDRQTVFSDKILTAAAIVNNETFEKFKTDIQRQAREQSQKPFITEWQSAVKLKSKEFKEAEKNLEIQKNKLQAEIDSLEFITNNETNFIIPSTYVVTDNGIQKFDGKNFSEVCLSPVEIQKKITSKADGIEKFSLRYKTGNKWKSTPPQLASTLFNSRKIVDLADYGLPVSSANALLLSQYLNAFKFANAELLPEVYSVTRPGWYNFFGKNYFIDPRRNCTVTDNNKKYDVIVDSNNFFIGNLKSAGNIQEWARAYELAKSAPVARATVAASVAPILLKIVGERNFVFYVHGHTRGGKSTCLLLGASAVGSTEMAISFNGTNNGLLALAADCKDFPFIVDEKQAADLKLKKQLQEFVYIMAEGKTRARARRDGTLGNILEFHNITICNGETEFLDDNATGGAHTRLLQIAAPKVILEPDKCKIIRDIIKANYGVIFPIVTDKILSYGTDQLIKKFDSIVAKYQFNFKNILQEYCRYLSLIAMGDAFLNIALGADERQAFIDAISATENIFDLVPTLEEIDDTEREKNFVKTFIAMQMSNFIGTPDYDTRRAPVGKFDRNEKCFYVIVKALKAACEENNFDYKKLVADLVNSKFITTDEKIHKGRTKPYDFILKKINGVPIPCYKISSSNIDATPVEFEDFEEVEL